MFLRKHLWAWDVFELFHDWIERTFVDEKNCPHKLEPGHSIEDCPWCKTRAEYRFNRWTDARHKAGVPERT